MNVGNLGKALLFGAILAGLAYVQLETGVNVFEERKRDVVDAEVKA